MLARPFWGTGWGLAPRYDCCYGLVAVRVICTAGRPTFGPLWQDSGFVFIHPNGTPLSPDQIAQDFVRIVRRYNLPHLTFHGLRHAYATLGLIAGIDSKVVSESLGHSTITITITLDLYSHVMHKMKETHAQIIANLLKREI